MSSLNSLLGLQKAFAISSSVSLSKPGLNLVRVILVFLFVVEVVVVSLLSELGAVRGSFELELLLSLLLVDELLEVFLLRFLAGIFFAERAETIEYFLVLFFSRCNFRQVSFFWGWRVLAPSCLESCIN